MWGALAVIALHVSGAPFRAYPGRPTAGWLLANVWNSGSRWAVPVYLLLSGYLLLGLGRREGPWLFWRRRATRIAVPRLFWGSVYALWYGARTVGEVVHKVLIWPDAAYHLWFLYAVVVLYALAPALRACLDRLSLASGAALCAACFLPFLRIPGVPSLLRDVELPRWLELGLPYVGYFLLGALLARGRREGRLLWPLLGAAASLAVVVGGTALATVRQGGIGGRAFQHPLNPAVIALSFCLCLLARRAGDRFPGPALDRYAPAVLGVYLVHPLVMELLGRAGIRLGLFPWWAAVPALCACVAVLSLAAVLGIRQVPGLRRVV